MHSRIGAADIAFAVVIFAGCSGAPQSNLTPANGLGPSVGSPTTLMRALNAGQESAIYRFGGKPDAGAPFGNVLLDGNGNIFGISNGGGTSDDGAVYKVLPSGSEQVLYSFQGGSDGAGSESGLIAGKDGVLYGMTDFGGGAFACTFGCGTVFEMVPSGSGYSERVIYAFQGSPDGSSPLGNLLLDKTGALYGTTNTGGTSATCTNGSGVPGCGTVFKLTSNGSGYSEQLLYSFQGGSDGKYPKDTLIADSTGALYGTTEFGGGTSGCYPISSADSSCGLVFKITSSGNEKVLYRFQGGANDGGNPRSALLARRKLAGARPGSLFGTTSYGGSTTVCGSGIGCGTVFELTPAKSGYAERVIHNFSTTPGDGVVPSNQNGLLSDANGNLFGTTVSGGKFCCARGGGIVFELTPSGSSYTETILHNFKGLAEGAFPHASLSADAVGTLYGAAFSGAGGHCRGGCGLLFKVSP